MLGKLKELLKPSHKGPVYAVLSEFSDPHALIKAAEGVREEGYRNFDTHSPFPIHGMDKAMGLGQSKIGFIVFGGGVIGLISAYVMQWWMGGVDYPLNISGKPSFAIEPSIPVIFELTVLVAAFAAVFGMFAMNGLPRPYNPLFYSDRFAKASDDGFFLHIEAREEDFDVSKATNVLKGLGALNTEIIEDHGHDEWTAPEDEVSE